MHARYIISTHPDVKGNVSEALVRCVDECYAGAQLDFGHSGREAGDLSEPFQHPTRDFGDLPVVR